MTIIESIVQRISEYISKNPDCRYAIYPYGIAGHMVEIVLREKFDICPVAIIDRDKVYQEKIMNPDNLSSLDSNTVIIIATHNLKIFKEIKNSVECAGYRYLDMFPLCVGKHSFGGFIDTDNGYLIERIGSFCSFAPFTCVVANHNMTGVSTSAFFNGVDLENNETYERIMNRVTINNLMDNKKCSIGNDVWLGRNVIICNGAKIGNGVIAAAGSVITHDIPDYAIVGGVPAHIIRYRFETDVIEKLNRIQWWDWDDNKILEAYNDFSDVNEFCKKYYQVEDKLI